MAVVGHFENASDRRASGSIRETPEYSRSFTVRVDDPNTSLVDISAAPGIKYGDLHPEDNSVYVTNVEVTAEGDSLMIFKVRYTYTQLTDEAVTGGAASAQAAAAAGQPVQPPDPLSLPVSYWSGTSGLYSENRAFDRHGNMVVNSAGSPYRQGVPTDQVEEQLTLVKFYGLDEWDVLKRDRSAIGKINSTEWPGTGAGSEVGFWRVHSFVWNFRNQSSSGVTLSYYEATITFSYRKGLVWSPAFMKWNSGGDAAQAPFGQYVSPYVSVIPSQGYDELRQNPSSLLPDMVRQPILREISYTNCAGQPITPPAGSATDPCGWPLTEEVTEPQPLTKAGKLCPPNTQPCLILVDNTKGWHDFHDFGPSPA